MSLMTQEKTDNNILSQMDTSTHTERKQPSSTDLKSFRLGSKTIESVSGLTAGFITTLVSHPLDFIKLRLQLDTKSSTHKEGLLKIRDDLLALSRNSETLRFKSSNFVREIYRGIGPNLVGSTSAWGLYFMFYRQYKTLLHDFLIKKPASHDAAYLSKSSIEINHYQDKSLNSIHYLLCGFAAGWSTSLLTNPIWVIKTRMISTSRTTPGAYSSIMDGLITVFKTEGIRGYYKGLSPALVSVSQGALQFSIYDSFKQFLISRNNDKTTTNLSTFQYLYCSAISKMISTVTFYPLQVVRSRLQVNTDINSHTTMLQVSKDVIKGEGIKGFYKGVGPNLIRVLPATCITFSVYENMKRFLAEN